MLTRLYDRASYELNLKTYYKYYAMYYASEGIIAFIGIVLVWIYVPLARFILHASYKSLLDKTIHIGDAWLGLHPTALADTCDVIYEDMDTDTLGNTLITIVVV